MDDREHAMGLGPILQTTVLPPNNVRPRPAIQRWSSITIFGLIVFLSAFLGCTALEDLDTALGTPADVQTDPAHDDGFKALERLVVDALEAVDIGELPINPDTLNELIDDYAGELDLGDLDAVVDVTNSLVIDDANDVQASDQNNPAGLQTSEDLTLTEFDALDELFAGHQPEIELDGLEDIVVEAGLLVVDEAGDAEAPPQIESGDPLAAEDGNAPPSAYIPVFATDSSLSQSLNVGTGGGQITLGSPAQPEITMVIPEGALREARTITITPITSVEEVPSDGAFVAGVQFEPDGLKFNRPVIVTIATDRQFDRSELTGFGFGAGGTDFHLRPLTVGAGNIVFTVTHFSSVGSFTGQPAGCAVSNTSAPTSTSALTALECALHDLAAAQSAGTVDPAAKAAANQSVSDAMADWQDTIVEPKIAEVLSCFRDTSCAIANGGAKLAEALNSAGEWEAMVQQISGTIDIKDAERLANVADALIRELLNIAPQQLDVACAQVGTVDDLMSILQVHNQVQYAIDVTGIGDLRALGDRCSDAFDRLIDDFVQQCEAAPDEAAIRVVLTEMIDFGETALFYGIDFSDEIADCADRLKPTAIEVDPELIRLEVGESGFILALATNNYGDPVPQAEVSWRSIDESVATVVGGNVTAVGEGTTSVLAELVGSEVVPTPSARTVIVVGDPVIQIDPEEVAMFVDDLFTLNATVVDSTGAPMPGAIVRWETSDAEIADVDLFGTLLAVNPGQVTIFAEYAGIYAQAIVYVLECCHLSIDAPGAFDGRLWAGESMLLELHNNDLPITHAPVTWESSDESVLAIDQTGLVTALGHGVVTVSAMVVDEWMTAEIDVDAKGVFGERGELVIDPLVPSMTWQPNCCSSYEPPLVSEISCTGNGNPRFDPTIQLNTPGGLGSSVFVPYGRPISICIDLVGSVSTTDIWLANPTLGSLSGNVWTWTPTYVDLNEHNACSFSGHRLVKFEVFNMLRRDGLPEYRLGPDETGFFVSVFSFHAPLRQRVNVNLPLGMSECRATSGTISLHKNNTYLVNPGSQYPGLDPETYMRWQLSKETPNFSMYGDLELFERTRRPRFTSWGGIRIRHSVSTRFASTGTCRRGQGVFRDRAVRQRCRQHLSVQTSWPTVERGDRVCSRSGPSGQVLAPGLRAGGRNGKRSARAPTHVEPASQIILARPAPRRWPQRS
ncbi:MAG: Ig-like domain-containing protein [Dehalococcoidia bacterium]|nr:Ig-like domain-containing protein [Dehalococcoidia bacterium]